MRPGDTGIGLGLIRLQPRSLIDWFLAQEGPIDGFTRAVFSGMIDAGWGRIANIASTAGTKGERGYASTANGPAAVYKVRLDSVRVGDISITDVEALVHDGNALPLVLLGMSFLNRVEMRRDGQTMTLIKRV